jgi:predicted ABC-type transport system involved in lysophospholipase L1 biosynthesis ATPase subunit
LFLSSAGTAALERQAAERCAAASGATLYATAEAGAFAAAARSASSARSELGTAFLAATHDLAVLRAADRAVELHDGRLVALRPGETGGAEARRGSPAS